MVFYWTQMVLQSTNTSWSYSSMVMEWEKHKSTLQSYLSLQKHKNNMQTTEISKHLSLPATMSARCFFEKSVTALSPLCSSCILNTIQIELFLFLIIPMHSKLLLLEPSFKSSNLKPNSVTNIPAASYFDAHTCPSG